MNKIEKLIQELCPGGVPMRQLGELVNIRNGKDFKHLGLGSVPVYGSGGVMTYVNSSVHEQPSVLIPRKGSLKNLLYVDKPFWTVDTIFWTEIGPLVEAKFLFYVLETKRLAGLNVAGGVPSLTQTMLNGVTIPTPPIRVQKEIVLILDKFAQLEAELEAELEARKNQFSYFCNLFFSENQSERRAIPISTLGEFGEFRKGNGLQKSDFSDDGDPCIHYGQIHTRFGSRTFEALTRAPSKLTSKLRVANPGDLIIADTAEDFAGVAKATAWLGDNPIAVGGHTLIYSHSFDSTFISYFFRSANFQDQKNRLAKGVKVKDISSTAIAKIRVPVPDIETQRHIARVLSQLDDLVSESPVGLFGEIQVRRKQYEYYRNKLLTFKELDAA